MTWGASFEHTSTIELPCGLQGITVGYHAGGAWTLAWQPDGSHLASGGEDGLVRVWNLSSRRASETLRGHNDQGVTSIDWSADSTILASVGLDETIKLWDTDSWDELDSLDTNGTVNAIKISPDGSLIAGAGNDNTVRIWAVTDAQNLQLVQTLTDHTDRVLSIAWSNDGNMLASGSVDETIKIWDLSAGAEAATLLQTLSGHTEEVTGLVFFPDDAVGSTGRDQTIRIWNATSGEELLTGELTEQSLLGYLSLALDPKDGVSLATGSEDDYPLVHWTRGDSGMLSLGYTAFNGDDTNAVAFRPSEDGLASASGDGAVRLLPYGVVLSWDGGFVSLLPTAHP